MVVQCVTGGGTVWRRWWNYVEQVVLQCTSGGGTMVSRWWNDGEQVVVQCGAGWTRAAIEHQENIFTTK